MTTNNWEPTKDDFSFLMHSMGIDSDEYKDRQEDSSLTNYFDELIGDSDESGNSEHEELLDELSHIVLQQDPESLLDFVATRWVDIREFAREDEAIVQLLIIGYKFGIAQKSGQCANDLGNLYYLGELVEQDYTKAADLYQLAMEWDCYQSIINLGYIYEYGRLGEPDYHKAFMYYALAAALDLNYEALYKLGDMFSRGGAVPRDFPKAFKLWERSYQIAEDLESTAQAAIRLAPCYMNPKQYGLDIEFNPMIALHLYQMAESGIRISLAKGMSYYQHRLQEAIRGQAAAREAIDLGK